MKAHSISHGVPDPELKEEGGAVAVTAEKAITTAAVNEYGDDVGAGMEDLSTNELLVPFVRILQSNSPAVAENLVPDARAGMLINSATNQIVSGADGLPFVPVKREHLFVEYIPRDAGGGFQGIKQPHDPLIKQLRASQGEFGKLVLDNGNELIETFSLYGVAQFGPDDFQNVVVGYASTQIRKYRMLVTRMASLVGSPPKYPLFAFRWTLGTQQEQNKKGKYHGWRIGLHGGSPEAARLAPTEPLYQLARSFNHLLKAGLARADFTTDTQGDGDETSDATESRPASRQGTATGEEEIPF